LNPPIRRSAIPVDVAARSVRAAGWALKIVAQNGTAKDRAERLAVAKLPSFDTTDPPACELPARPGLDQGSRLVCVDSADVGGTVKLRLELVVEPD
jgi:hypothetical protein